MNITANKTYSIYHKVQSVKASKRNKNVIVLSKEGESYYAYEEDADEVTGICGVGQINREGCRLNIAEIKADRLSIYLARIIRAGWKIVILDETE